MIENLSIDRRTGQVTNHDQCMIGLHKYDTYFELLFCVCELLNSIKEKKFLDDDSSSLTKTLTRNCDSVLREFLRRIAKEEQTLVPLVDIVFEKTAQHIKNILSGIEYQVYQQNIKDYSLAKELLGFFEQRQDHSTAFNDVFPNLFFLQHYFQTTLRLKDAYCYVHHLLPSACANFRRSEIVSIANCLQSSIIKQSTVTNAGGFTDIFDIEAQIVVNAALGMCVLLVKVQNNSKIFFEEVRLKVEVQGMVHSAGQSEFLIDTFAASSSRRLKLCYHKQDFSLVKANIKVSTKSLSNISSEMVAVSLAKLDSLAATRDVFEKKQLSAVQNLHINLFDFATPVSLVSLPMQTVRSFEEKLSFSSNIYSFSLSSIDPDTLLTNSRLQSYLLVLDTKPRPIYFKERTAEQFIKLRALMQQNDKAVACYFLYPMATFEADFCALVVRLEKKEGLEEVQAMLVVQSNIVSQGE